MRSSKQSDQCLTHTQRYTQSYTAQPLHPHLLSLHPEPSHIFDKKPLNPVKEPVTECSCGALCKMVECVVNRAATNTCAAVWFDRTHARLLGGYKLFKSSGESWEAVELSSQYI